MKTLILITLTMALGLMGVGCSKSNSTNANNAYVAPIVNEPTAPGISSGGPIFTGGATVAFKPVSKSIMNDYASSAVPVHTLVNPTNYKININLSQSATSRYSGEVSIAYTDAGQNYYGVFTAGAGKNSVIDNRLYNNVPMSEYNYWFKFENQIVFTGFFQDQFGAITLTLIPETTTTSSGSDAEPVTTTTYKGSIYYKNFPKFVNGVAVNPQQSPDRFCWFITYGPYDCRSNVIQTKCGLYPGSEAGYQLLGTFSGVNIKTAFNLE